MSRRTKRPTGFYDAVEYIGPRPQKPRPKPHFFGGWVILLIAIGAGWFFGRQLLPTLRAAEDGTSIENVERTIADLRAANTFGDRVAAGALAQTRFPAVYDDSYYTIPYPNGDIPANKGKAEDVVIRAYREVGLDLQQLVHEDMEKNFREYEHATKATDTNTDHRQAPNLKRFFERNGETLSTSRDTSEYKPGDVVFLTRPGSGAMRTGGARSQIEMHVAIIVPAPGRPGEPALVHNLDASTNTKWEDVLLSYQIIGHYRFGK